MLCSRRSGFPPYLLGSTWLPLQDGFCRLIVFVRHGTGEGCHSLAVADVETNVRVGDEELDDDAVLIADGSVDRGSALCILAKKTKQKNKSIYKRTDLEQTNRYLFFWRMTTITACRLATCLEFLNHTVLTSWLIFGNPAGLTCALTLAPNSKRHCTTSSSPQLLARWRGVCPSRASSSPSPLGPGRLELFTSQPLHIQIQGEWYVETTSHTHL